jgi:hypothetical protein
VIDDDAGGDDAPWAPVFTAHTPGDAVQELADHYARRAVIELRASVSTALAVPPDSPGLDARLVEAVMQMHVRDLFARIHQRLKAEQT